MKLKEYPLSLFHSLYLRYAKPVQKKSALVPLVISLTSIPSRLAILDIVIASLLNQTVQAQTIVLWLNTSLKNKLPSRLKNLQSDVFKIKYCEGTSSFRKLLPSLKTYQNLAIVTCDDDMIYPKNWLENLYHQHLKHPDSVISQVGRLITRDKEGKLLSYKQWPFIREDCTKNNFLPIGYGGVLYPPNTFDENVFNESLYLQLTPKADDLWFKAMAYLRGKKAVCASEKARPIPIIRSQQLALNNSNIHDDGNRRQWQALCDYYPELRNL